MGNPPVILPKVGNMTAPFTQGGLWLVRYTNLFDKLEFLYMPLDYFPSGFFFTLVETCCILS